MIDSFLGCFDRALRRRGDLLADRHETNALRLFGGEPEGLPGLIVDIFGETLIIQKHQGKCDLNQAALTDVARRFAESTGARSAYLKTFVPDRSHKLADDVMYDATPLWGEPTTAEILVREAGLNFVIRPYSGFSVGLFLDQRNNRQFLSRDMLGKRVLNLFSYTCGFSVACAARGAESVTSVDLYKPYLKWGERNFEVNGLARTGHYFVAQDIFDYFRFAGKKGLLFDLIILDPPSFSRNHDGAVFSVVKDANRLLAESATLLKPGGQIFFSSNSTEWTSQTLKKAAEPTLKTLGSATFLKLPEPSLDFETEVHSLSQLLARLD